MKKKELVMIEDIQNKIYSIRGVQVMMDKDLASLYQVETRVLNQAVKRNQKRFPQQFCFQLTAEEYECLRSQIVTLETDRNLKSQIVTSNSTSNLKSQIVTSSWGGCRTKPYVFTEQGVAMLSTVLRSDVAIEISVKIMDAFVAMRRFILTNAQLFQRLDTLEVKQLETDKKMERVLTAIESRDIRPKQGIFFEGQVFDAYLFVSDIFKSAKGSITIIDNYLDDSVLTLLTKRKKNVQVHLFTKKITDALLQDVKKCNEQYPPIEVHELRNSHDRFIIIDNTDIYHFGASLKDLGKKWFAFSKMDIGAVEMLSRIERLKTNKQNVQ